MSAAADVATLPPERQREVLAGGTKAVVKAASEVRATRRAKAPPAPEVRPGPGTQDVLRGLAGAVQMTKQVVHQLCGGDLVIGTSERETLLLAVGELHTLADWIDTLARGGRLDDELVKLLAAGS